MRLELQRDYHRLSKKYDEAIQDYQSLEKKYTQLMMENQNLDDEMDALRNNVSEIRTVSEDLVAVVRDKMTGASQDGVGLFVRQTQVS